MMRICVITPQWINQWNQTDSAERNCYVIHHPLYATHHAEYRLWLHGFYGLYGPRCPLTPERPLNLITHSSYRNNQKKGYTCKTNQYQRPDICIDFSSPCSQILHFFQLDCTRCITKFSCLIFRYTCHVMLGKQICGALGPLLLTWFNLNPSMDK